MTSEEEKREKEKSTKNLILGDNHIQNDFFDKTKYNTKSNVIGGNKSKLNTKATYLKKPCYCSVNNELGTEYNTKSTILKRSNIPDNFIDKGFYNSKSIILKKTCQSKNGSTPIIKTSDLLKGNENIKAEVSMTSKGAASKNLLLGLKDHYDIYVLKNRESSIEEFCEVLSIARDTYYQHINGKYKTLYGNTLNNIELIIKSWENSEGALCLIEKYHKDERQQRVILEPRYRSTGVERILVSIFYETIVREHPEREQIDAFAERIISRVIAEKARNEGYLGFSDTAIDDALKKKNQKFSLYFLEKYEFLFKFSSVFSKSESKILIEAIQDYRKKAGKLYGSDLGRESVHESLRQEYDLVKALQIAYFKERKSHLTMWDLSLKITGNEGAGGLFTHHLFGSLHSIRFDAEIIFKIELWAKKNLDKHFTKIQKLIMDWRIENNDDSVYARQDTPLRKIAYDILILYAKVNDVVINLHNLDSKLKERFDKEMPIYFFGERFKEYYESQDSLTDVEKMNLVKIFVEENFLQNIPSDVEQLIQSDAEQIIEDIEEYNKLPRYTRLKITPYFTHLSPYQLKTLIYITKGMDVFYCDFFKDEELIKSGLDKVVEHHIDEDPEYEFIFQIYSDGNESYYRFKLAPLRFKSSHYDVHGHSKHFKSIANDIIEARMRHLYELDKKSYDKNFRKEEVAIQYYYPIFRDIFRYRKEYISTYGREINIWNEFENGKIHGLDDKNILIFTNNWVKSKIMSENSWFSNIYKRFYDEKYVPFIERVKEYCREYYKKDRTSKFFEWFLTVYLPSEIFP